MKNTILLAVIFAASAASVFGQCSASSSGSTVAAAEINAKACATATFIAGTGGVTANTLVITDASSPAKAIAGTGAGGYGVALSTVIATASVQVQRYGQVPCVMDNAATAGDLVIPGTSTAIDCRDSGQTASSAISTSTRIIGVLLTSASSGATAIVELTPAHFGTLVSCTGQTVNLPTRVASTVYQNTTGCVLTVAGWILWDTSGGNLICAIGATSTPANNIWLATVPNSGYGMPFNFKVPNGWYYQLAQGHGGVTVELIQESY